MKNILFSMALFVITNQVLADGFTLKGDAAMGQLANEQVFSSFGCTGKNISPRLEWSNAPKGTKSFAVTVYDPDAPTGSGWWHWLVFNIPASVNELVTDAGNINKDLAPKGSVQSINNYGKAGYGGACPPKGDKAHRYIFTVYALKVEKLPLVSNAMPALVGYYMNNNAIAKASLIAYYAH